jgi:hypothetical protein
MRPPGKTQPERLLAQARRLHVLHLRQSGATYRVIADALHRDARWRGRLPRHYGPRQVYEDVAIALAHQRKELDETVAVIRQQELERLDRMLVGVWARAQNGDCQAIASVLKIMERRGRLLPGLEAPWAMSPNVPRMRGSTPDNPHDDPLPIEAVQGVAWHLAQLGMALQARGNGCDRGDEPA